MTRSVFACRCGYRLGWVDGDRLEVERAVESTAFLKRGMVVLICPSCKITRTYHGGIVELHRR